MMSGWQVHYDEDLSGSSDDTCTKVSWGEFLPDHVR